MLVVIVENGELAVASLNQTNRLLGLVRKELAFILMQSNQNPCCQLQRCCVIDQTLEARSILTPVSWSLFLGCSDQLSSSAWHHRRHTVHNRQPFFSYFRACVQGAFLIESSAAIPVRTSCQNSCRCIRMEKR